MEDTYNTFKSYILTGVGLGTASINNAYLYLFSDLNSSTIIFKQYNKQKINLFSFFYYINDIFKT
jgi:hypothetical protein